MAVALSWAYMPAALYEVNTMFEPEFIKSNADKYRLTEVESTPRTLLSPEIDAVFNECKNDGWADELKTKSKGILYSSYLNINEFAFYLKDVTIIPNVVPFKNGCLGFEWNYNGACIAIVFCGNNRYIYSIITDTINEYGENYQTETNQIDLIGRITRILKNA